MQCNLCSAVLILQCTDAVGLALVWFGIGFGKQNMTAEYACTIGCWQGMLPRKNLVGALTKPLLIMDRHMKFVG